MTHILYKQPEKANDGDNPVDRALGGGPKDIWEKFEKRFNLTYLAFYGLTETGCLTTYTPEDKPRKIGSIGLPVPFQRVEIVNEDDEVRPPYEQGEIVVRPEIPYSMMLQYYKDSEATVAAWKNLWFHTGDIGYKDEDGYLFFVGRRANVIRCKGENVSAEEVEQVMNGHRGVKESAIIGVPSEVGEEEIKAFIVPNKGSRVLPEELIRFCEERLAYFKVPRYIEFIDELPMVSGVNRIERYKLKQRGIGESWDREKAGYKLKRKYPAS
jgi:crotonobetaine/carnitine-CoA ligase